MNILDLPNLKLLSVKETDDAYNMKAVAAAPPPACQNCGSVRNSALVKFGGKEQLYMDIPVRGKRVGIYVQRQRYQCRECNSTFYELLPDMDDKRFATRRLVEFIEQESLNNLIRVANRMGRGYSFDALRAKILFADRIKRPKYERIITTDDETEDEASGIAMESLIEYMTSKGQYKVVHDTPSTSDEFADMVRSKLKSTR
jgi:transposase